MRCRQPFCAVLTALARSVGRREFVSFGRDARGSGIVEFGLIAPTMLLIYCALGELATALENGRKVSAYTRTVADLFGRSNVSSADPLFDAAAVILQPFDSSKATIRISAMGVYKASGKYYAVTCSSVARGTSASPRFNFSASKFDKRVAKEDLAPPAYQQDGARFIMAEVAMPYTPGLGANLFKWIGSAGGLTFTETLPWPERPDTEIVLPGGSACG